VFEYITRFAAAAVAVAAFSDVRDFLDKV